MASGYTHLSKLVAAFRHAYAVPPTIAARAPGRVNLIGEHTDYNDGWVLPVALQVEVNIAAAPREDSQIRLFAPDLNASGVVRLADEEPPDDLWLRYPWGVARALQEAGHDLTGIDAVYAGDVPVGAGLSSSAAVETAFVHAFAAASGLTLTPEQVARLGQRAETAFVGVPSGIMDQFISATGKVGHALLLDCRTLHYEHVPIDLPGVAIAVIDTTKRRELATSAYGDRRADCEAAVERLRTRLPTITALRDVSPEQLDANRDLLTEVQHRRVRHVVSENVRTLAAADALRHGDAARIGALMRASHESLRDLYEVSSTELDAAVEVAWSVPGVIGARMTGAGFGGCVVALVEQPAVAALEAALAAEYTARTGRTAKLFICRAVDGAESKRLH